MLKRAIVCASLMLPLMAQTPTRKIDFRRDVQPIFKEQCIGCHGPTLQRNDLRLDRRSDAMRGGTIPVIGRGSSDGSRLYQRLIGNQFGLQMPPTGALSAQQVRIIKDWIDQGAVWPDEDSGETPAPPPDPKASRMMSLLRDGDGAGFRKALNEDPKAVNRKGPAGSTPLMYAVLYGDAATVKLLLDKGADPNLRNDAGATALMWAARDLEKARLLVDHGADVNAKSDGSRTPLLIASGRPDVMKLLLDHGANPNVSSPGLMGDITPLDQAAGNEAALRMLIAHGVDLKKSGPFPIFLSMVTHCDPCAELLLKSAPPPILSPAMLFLSPPLADTTGARMLLDRGADANSKDPFDNPALTLAAGAEIFPVDFVKALLSHGADINAKNALGETALDVARRHGRTPVVDALLQAGAKGSDAPPIAVAPKPAASPRAALARTIPLLQHNDAVFLQKSGCVSCHNNTMTTMTVVAARKSGLAIDEAAARAQMRTMGEYLEGWRERALQGIGIPGDSDTIAPILAALAENGYPANATTDAMAMFVKDQQLPTGQWVAFASRPPLESSAFASTMMAVRALQAYAPKPQRAEYVKAVQSASAWMAKAEAQTVEDRACRLLGLGWTDGDKAVVRKTAAELLKLQRPDGGWSQIPTRASDAFATGQVLAGLQVSGALPVSDPAYQRGVRFLLNTQAEDGTWYVERRSLPIQPYFESGFPYGRDQWISAAATNWAALALIAAK